MTVNLKTQKMLWGRAAARCSFKECRRRLVEDISETDDPTLVGENCHIAAEKDDGPRGDPSLSAEDRNRYANLILLCSIHHKIIDDNPAIWTVENLLFLKNDHETWVESSLGLDKIKLRDDMIYAQYIDEWSRLAHLDEWLAWSSHILGGGQPRIWTDTDNDLASLRRWLLNRVWPGRYAGLENAFKNFRRVLEDFHNTLHENLVQRPNTEVHYTEKFYKIRQWDTERYNALLSEYEFHVDIICDLMLELTRAANFVCSEVRTHISHNYRLAEGNLMVQRGPDMNMQFSEFVPQYTRDQVAEATPYPGLHEFYDVRDKRDWQIGKGRPRE